MQKRAKIPWNPWNRHAEVALQLRRFQKPELRPMPSELKAKMDADVARQRQINRERRAAEAVDDGE